MICDTQVRIMKKPIVGIGFFLLIIGIVILAFTLVDLPLTTTEPYQVPRSSDIIDESFTVGVAQRTSTLNESDIIHIELEVTAGENKEIDFYVQDETTTYIEEARVSIVDMNWTVPSDGTYYFVYDNSLSWITSKNVTTRITRYWNQTNYRNVTKYCPRLSYEFSYVGFVLSFAGTGIIILGSLPQKRLLGARFSVLHGFPTQLIQAIKWR